MAGEFSRGFESGKKTGGGGIFTTILNAVATAKERRNAEDKQRETEDRSFMQDLQKLGVKEQISLAEEKRKQQEQIQVFDPKTGQPVFTMPKGSKFLPKEKKDIMDQIADLLGNEKEKTTPSIFGGKKKEIRVKLKSSGQTGKIPEDEFDPNLYERL